MLVLHSLFVPTPGHSLQVHFYFCVNCTETAVLCGRVESLPPVTALLVSICYAVNICLIKARRMRWAGHVARMGEVRGAYNILVGRPEGRTTLRWILGK
jgi:hypothetical protein